jgi:DNA repair protein RecN (Recombination protein N)
MIERLADIDYSFSDRRDELASTVVVVEELARYLQSYSLDIDFAPEELDTMRERLQALNGIRKKYGGSLEAVLDHQEKIEQEISLAKNYDSTIRKQNEELHELRKSTGRLAAKLSRKRRQVAKSIEKSIIENLRELGIENGQFSVRIERRKSTDDEQESVIDQEESFHSTPAGIDNVEFYISTNAGEDPKPLAKTASGGEVSRIMLALKSILAKNDRLPLLVFDEIDTGISGRIAQKVGGALRNLADFHQIVAITHLPQIAAMSHHHFVVEKSEHDGRTVTSIRRLDQEEHTTEVARLVSGEDVTESSIRTARELMEE